jgi:hypothetical protein
VDLQLGLVDPAYVQAVATLNLTNWEHPVSNRNAQNVELQ